MRFNKQALHFFDLEIKAERSVLTTDSTLGSLILGHFMNTETADPVVSLSGDDLSTCGLLWDWTLRN